MPQDRLITVHSLRACLQLLCVPSRHGFLAFACRASSHRTAAPLWYGVSATASIRTVQDGRAETGPLAASVHRLANLVYGDRAHLAAAAIPCALTGVGVRLHRYYVAALKVPSPCGKRAVQLHRCLETSCIVRPAPPVADDWPTVE